MHTHQDNILSHRCHKCRKLLAKEAFSQGGFEIKCIRCGELNTVFREMKEQMVITDPAGRIMYVNSEVERVTGYTLHEVVGKTPRIWGGQMSPAFYAELWRIISVEKKGVVAKLTNRHKSGRLYDALLRISPIIDKHNAIVFFVGIEVPISSTQFTGDEWLLPRIDIY